MPSLVAKCLWSVVLVWVSCCIAPAQQQNPVSSPTSPPAPTPPPRTVQIPSSPDSPMPDPATLPIPFDKSKSKVKRAVNRLFPVCLDAMVHTCWARIPEETPGISEEEREYVKDMEVGGDALKGGNYRGAELRFRHALEYEPGNPEAVFRLAQSLDKLRKIDEAQETYQMYLDIDPKGVHMTAAQKALHVLAKKATQTR